MSEYKLVDAEQLDRAVQATADAIKTKGGTTEKIPWDKNTGFEEAVLSIKGGGTGLNIEVIGGTEQPDSPAENTIWVNTATDITGWAFRADAPSNPVDGTVWFNISSESRLNLNVLTENELCVYINGAKQFISNAWNPVDILIYSGGEWKSGEKYLFKSGEQYKDVTGGWQIYKPDQSSEGTIGNTLKTTGAIDFPVYAYTQKSIAFNGRKTLYAKVKRVNGSASAYARIFVGSSLSSMLNKADKTLNNLNQEYVIPLALDGIESGKVWCGSAIPYSSSTTTFEYTEVWME